MIEPTHAGGIVYRLRSGAPEFLVVGARRSPHEWVYPKGHVEPGEPPEQAAVREVAEEAGVRTNVIEPLEDVTIDVNGVRQVIRYFLMHAVGEVGAGEGRRVAWFSAREAADRLQYGEARASLQKALDALQRLGIV